MAFLTLIIGFLVGFILGGMGGVSQKQKNNDELRPSHVPPAPMINQPSPMRRNSKNLPKGSVILTEGKTRGNVK